MKTLVNKRFSFRGKAILLTIPSRLLYPVHPIRKTLIVDLPEVEDDLKVKD